MADNDAAHFLDLLSSMGLDQHIDFPSHTSGNTLDLLISRTLNSNLIQDVRTGTYISDHYLALSIINISPGGLLPRILGRGVPRRFVNPNPI